MDRDNIESALLEHRRFPPPEQFVARARLRAQEIEAMRRKAAADHVGFWADLARKSLYWHKPFTVALDDSKAPNYRWFPDGELNVSWNCLDVHLEVRGDKLAIIFEDEAGVVRRLSYRQLHGEVCRLANGLKQLGVGRGDRVVIYMPMIPEAVIAMQACARIGAVHSVVFGGFSFNSIRDRIEDAGARVVLTADGGRRGGNVIELKSAVDKALEGACPTIEKVVVLKNSGVPVKMRSGRDVWWSELVKELPAECPPEWVDAEHPLVSAVHLRFHGQTEGHTARQRGLPAQRQGHKRVGVRPQGRRYFLVHGRHRLGHRPQLRRLRSAGSGRDNRHVRGRADGARRRPFLAHLPGPRRDDFLHRAHRDPRLDEIGR